VFYDTNFFSKAIIVDLDLKIMFEFTAGIFFPKEYGFTKT
tara:strand:+ start:2441 stop:2560 length:120 start_codon:yes stop_codon:yes gene_type:complete